MMAKKTGKRRKKNKYIIFTPLQVLGRLLDKTHKSSVMHQQHKVFNKHHCCSPKDKSQRIFSDIEKFWKLDDTSIRELLKDIELAFEETTKEFTKNSTPSKLKHRKVPQI